MSPDQISDYMNKIDDGWKVIEDKKIQREFKFDNFKQALDFVNKVSSLAEEQDHHPGIYFTWGKVKITLYTHKIGGLHENDFILASKIDAL